MINIKEVITIKKYYIMRKQIKNCEKSDVFLLPPKKFIEINKKEDLTPLLSEEPDYFDCKKVYKRIKKLNGIMIAVIENDCPVAFGTVIKKGSNDELFKIRNTDVYLNYLYTYPKFRGKGIMPILMDELINKAAERWGVEMFVYV